MSTVFIRNLIFQSNNLGKESNLLFTFNGPVPGVGDHSPVVWRVTTFGKDGSYEMRATYRSQLAFTKPQVDGGIIVGAAAAVDINAGQQTTLTKSGKVYKFSTPVEGTPALINDTGETVDLTLSCHAEKALLPTPMLYFDEVGDASKVTAQFTPNLRAYVTTSDYQASEILRGEIGTPILWDEDLAALPETTTWKLTWDGNTGLYMIARA